MSTDFFYSDFDISEIIIDPTVKKINSFSELEMGWDFGEGYPIKDKVIKKAIDLNKLGRSYQFSTNALPNSDGSVILNLFMEDNFILLTVKENDTLDLRYEKGRGEDYEVVTEKENISFQEVSNYLKWFSLEYYTLGNTKKIWEDLEAIVSLTSKEEYQYLKKNVPEKRQAQIVTTFSNSRTRLQAIL